MSKIAIILVRGLIMSRTEIKDTLKMLKLMRKNYCVVYDKTQSIMGMVKKVKDHATWGDIDEETYNLLKEKRGEPDPKDKTQLKKYFRLNPPRKGYGRKGIKKSFHIGGALGERGIKINDLIRRMI